MYARITIGIDLGITSRHQVCALGQDGSKRLMTISTTPSDLDGMLEAVGGPDHVDVVLEPTGLSWVAVATYLMSQGCCVYRVDTRKAHGFRKVLSRDVKSDRADAEALARMRLVAPEQMRPMRQLEREQFMLARLLKTREGIVDARAEVVLHIKSALPAYLPALVRQLVGGELGRIERMLLRDFLDPRWCSMPVRRACVPL